MEKRRINIIDEVRGLCIILVVIYHAFYSLAMVFRLPWFTEIFYKLMTFQPVLPAMFILISGISLHLSRSNVKRGLKLLAISIGITVVLAVFMPEQIIWFGILHFLAFANIICGLLKKFIDKIPAAVGIVICVLLFLLTYNLQRGYLGFEGIWTLSLPREMYTTDLTMMLGFYSPTFYSSDYCPLIPWIFMFLLGAIMGRFVKRLPDSLCRTHIKPLAFIGRHTLIIYLVHQPVIVGAVNLIMMINGGN